MGEMHRAIARENADRQKQDRFASTLVIAASIIAAVRLAREPDIGMPSPRPSSAIAGSARAGNTTTDRIESSSTDKTHSRIIH